MRLIGNVWEVSITKDNLSRGKSFIGENHLFKNKMLPILDMDNKSYLLQGCRNVVYIAEVKTPDIISSVQKSH